MQGGIKGAKPTEKKTLKKKGKGEKDLFQKELYSKKKWVICILLLGSSLYIFIAIVCFFLYWKEDQSVVFWGNYSSVDSKMVLNPTGKLGALVASDIVGKWFGVFGIALPIATGLLALRVLGRKFIFLHKTIIVTLLIMILGSLSLGLMFGSGTMADTGLGGAQGIYVAEWFVNILGVAGLGILLLMSWMLLAVYVNSRTIQIVNGLGRGIYNQGIRVGDAVVSQASGLAHRSKDENDDVNKEIKSELDDNLLDDNLLDDDLLDDDIDQKLPLSEVKGVVLPHGQQGGAIVTINDSYRDNPPFLATEVVDKITSAESFEIVNTLEDSESNIVVFGDVDDNRPPVYSKRNNINPATEFEVIDANEIKEPEVDLATIGSGDLSIGGVIETVSRSGVGVDDQMSIVQSEHSDTTLCEEDIDASLYDPTLELSSYQRPPIDLLEDHSIGIKVSEAEIHENKNQIIETLKNFGISIDKIKATIGPTVTLYEIIPSAGVRISKIKNLEDDIALSLKALGIRIIAPMPGEGTIGIEVPNKSKEIVSMYSVIKTVKFQESKYELPIVLGRTIQNEAFVVDLATMPHMLVAGATGQGKSVGLNAIVSSLLYRKHPAELKFVMIDPKKVELTLYAKLERHFLAKMECEEEAIITETQNAVHTLNSLCIEMDNRYNLLRFAGVKKISEYNTKFISRRLNPNKGHRFMPYIVVIIDEFADMIMTAGREVEQPITRLAQLARAVGIHLIIATQRPDVKVITGLIKANFPARIAFKVSSMIDSRTILDRSGANQLIGRGDMLVSINGEVTRVQCAFIDTPEIDAITDFIYKQKGYGEPYELPEFSPESESGSVKGDVGQVDQMFDEVARFIVQSQQGSTSSIQRRFSIGYNRAGRIMDQLEATGIVGRAEGSKPREVLVYDQQSLASVLSNLNL